MTDCSVWSTPSRLPAASGFEQTSAFILSSYFGQLRNFKEFDVKTLSINFNEIGTTDSATHNLENGVCDF